MGNEKYCVKTNPMDDVDVDVDIATTKQIGRMLRDAGDDYDRLIDRRMGRGHFFNLTSVCCRVLRQFSGWLWVQVGWRVFLSAGFALWEM